MMGMAMAMVILGEPLVLGINRRSCWDLYRRTHTALEIFIRKKVHSVSGSEEAVCPSNAKRKRHCAGTQPLAGNRRVIPLLRDSSGPFVAARNLLLTRKKKFWASLVATLSLILKCHSGSSPSPSP